MSMFKGFSNAFKIPELRKKILITLGLVAVCRLVSLVPAIGVDWVALQTAVADRIANASNSSGFSMFDWFDAFTGGALGQCSIGFLSIWPYISAQIVIQLLSSVIPSLQKMKKEGENGRQQLAQITRYLTIGICIAQSYGVCTALLHPQSMGLQGMIVTPDVIGSTTSFYFMNILGMTTASLFVMWVADQITTFGIGNGGSLIIMINIASRLPNAIMSAWHRYFKPIAGQQRASIAEFAVVMLIGFAVIMGTVLLTQGVRKVAIHATRRAMGGGNTYGMQQTFMPLRVNYAGVMPIIFAQPLITIPGALLARIQTGRSGFLDSLHNLGENLQNMTSTTHLVIMAAMILFFTFFWVATQFNAVEISDNLKKDGSYVPGIRPGSATAEYLDAVMTRVTLIGATGLLVVALVPSLLMRIFTKPTPINWSIVSFFGGTSLLIIVGVALDTLRIMESHLLVRKYDGFLRHGSLRGRGGM